MDVSKPKVSIVIPNLESGIFLQQCLISVIGQRYENKEIIVVDAGISHFDRAIIQKFKSQIDKVVFGQDTSQSNAINIGMKMSSGEILCWLNSDDFYTDELVLKRVADEYMKSKFDLLFGKGFWFKHHSSALNNIYITESRKTDLLFHSSLLQPATFFSRTSFFVNGGLDETLNYCFDWKLFNGIVRDRNCSIRFIDFPLAAYRIHKNIKTLRGGFERSLELARVGESIANKPWKENYAITRQQFESQNRFWCVLHKVSPNCFGLVLMLYLVFVQGCDIRTGYRLARFLR